MSYTEYLNRKKAAAPVIVDTRPKMDASTYTRHARVRAAVGAYAPTNGVINNPMDLNDVDTVVQKRPQETTKASGGSVPDASIFTDYVAGLATIRTDTPAFAPSFATLSTGSGASVGSVTGIQTYTLNSVPNSAGGTPPGGAGLGVSTSMTSTFLSTTNGFSVSFSAPVIVATNSPSLFANFHVANTDNSQLYVMGFFTTTSGSGTLQCVSNASVLVSGVSYTATDVLTIESDTTNVYYYKTTAGTRTLLAQTPFNAAMTQARLILNVYFLPSANIVSSSFPTSFNNISYSTLVLTGGRTSRVYGKVVLNGSLAGMTSVSNCNSIPEPRPQTSGVLGPNQVQKSAGDWVRLNKDCVASGRLGESHEPGMKGTPQFIDDTISLNTGTFRIGTGSFGTVGSTVGSSNGSSAGCPPANHSHPVITPRAGWSARPTKGAGGLFVSSIPRPGDARKVGGLVPSDHLKYVEKHHGNDLNVNPRRVPTEYQIPANAPAHLKINDPGAKGA